MTPLAACVKLMIFDIDGVFTNGQLHYNETGEFYKTFHVLDGHGIKLLRQAGISVAIISARQSKALKKRANDLDVDYLIMGAADKRTVFDELLQKTRLTESECGYMGDDVIDLPILTRVGFSATVPNGHEEVKSRVMYVSQAYGGNGAVREVCDFILKAQNKYQALMETYLS